LMRNIRLQSKSLQNAGASHGFFGNDSLSPYCHLPFSQRSFAAARFLRALLVRRPLDDATYVGQIRRVQAATATLRL
jgi:hypothetical protein